MKMPVGIAVLALVLTACGDFPRDTEATLQQIRERGSFRAGIIAGAPQHDSRTRRFLSGIATHTAAAPTIVTGSGEALLQDLEHGRLDLVVGAMASDSPWRSRVHFLPAMTDDSAEGATPLTAMTRNGEHAWARLAHDEAERIAARP